MESVDATESTEASTNVETLPRLSVEMILRKSFCDSVKEYLQNCSLAGVKQIFNPNIGHFVRVFWLLIFGLALATDTYFLQYVWSDTLTKPLIISMESSTYPIKSIDFPAVAFCNINRISKKALKKLAMDEYPGIVNNKTLEYVELALLNWGRLIDYSYNDTMRNHPVVMRMIEKYRAHNGKIVEIMKKDIVKSANPHWARVLDCGMALPLLLRRDLCYAQQLAPKCEEMVIKCAWEGVERDCRTLFSMHRIANRGHCCAFNYWAKRMGSEIKRQKEPGYIYGLNVVLNPLVEDYAYPLHAMRGFEVLLLDPLHYADPSAGRVTHRICDPSSLVFVELKSTKQIASKEVRKYAVETRKCLFQDENAISDMESYSYSTCIVFCRIMTIFSLCKCTPYFFAIKDMQKGPICSLENLRCLNKYREKLFYLYPFNAESLKGLEIELQNSLFCPECLPDCELTQYTTKSYELSSIKEYANKEIGTNFLHGVNISNVSFVSVYHPLPDATLDLLDVVYYWYEVLSNIGGFSGIILGFSMISIIELVYYLTVRFVRHFYVNYYKYNEIPE